MKNYWSGKNYHRDSRQCCLKGYVFKKFDHERIFRNFQSRVQLYASQEHTWWTSKYHYSNGNKDPSQEQCDEYIATQAIAMLSAVLRSDEAIQVSVNIMNTFVKMRRFLTENALMFDKINSLELKQLEYQKESNEKFDQIFDSWRDNSISYWCIFERCRKKCFGITRIEDIGIVSDILQRLEIETEEAG